MKFDFDTWTSIEPELGPPKPLACDSGITSHIWQLEIEEGQITLTTDCTLCSDGINEVDREWFEGGPFPVRMHIHTEAGQPCYGIDPHVWIELIPVPRGEA